MRAWGACHYEGGGGCLLAAGELEAVDFPHACVDGAPERLGALEAHRLPHVPQREGEGEGREREGERVGG
eukprot:6240861-Prymnesium_polylepis.1